MPCPLIIGNDGSIRRIVADKYSVTVRPTAISFDPLLHRPRRNECNFLRRHVIR